MADVPVLNGDEAGAGPAGARRPGVLSLWGPVAAYCALIFGLSSISHVPALPGGMSDKTAHVLLYSGLGFLAARAVSGGAARAVRAGVILAVVAFSAVYGLSDECHQLFVPMRQFDLLDLASDVAGGAAGTAAWWAWGILWRLRDVV